MPEGPQELQKHLTLAPITPRDTHLHPPHRPTRPPSYIPPRPPPPRPNHPRRHTSPSPPPSHRPSQLHSTLPSTPSPSRQSPTSVPCHLLPLLPVPSPTQLATQRTSRTTCRHQCLSARTTMSR